MFLAEHFGCKVVGVDYSTRNVSQANELAAASSLASRVHCERADSELLPFPDGSYDAVCIADAQPIEGYEAYLEQAGLQVCQIEAHDDALQEMVQQIRGKLFGAEVLVGLKKLELPGVDLRAAKEMAKNAQEAIKRGHLGYTLISAVKR